MKTKIQKTNNRPDAVTIAMRPATIIFKHRWSHIYVAQKNRLPKRA